jgi:glycosyltransferase involved in cell wall biosynthesis
MLCCNFAHHVIISNDIWKDLITSRSVKNSKCTSVINYPDETIFSISDEKPEYEKGPFTIIYPGSLNYHQGVDIAIKAMNRIRRIAPDIKFDIYGVGPAKSSLEELIKEFNLKDTVSIRQPLPLEEIAKKMSSAHLGIVPKRADGFGNEAFSTKILEFMILGVPVIAAETKVDRYYFNDSLIEFFKSGDENSLAEKILFLYNDKSRREELYRNALRFAVTNCWNKKKSLYFNIVDRLCGNKTISEVEVQNVHA